MKKTLTCGPLELTLTLDPAGTLRAVALPAKVPAGLEPAHLAEALRELGSFKLSPPEAGDFVARAWEKLRRIPWGRAITYRELATAAGSPRAIRAAGQACAMNPLLLIVPCHRVVAETGLGGFAYGVEWKAKLLELEAAQ